MTRSTDLQPSDNTCCISMQTALWFHCGHSCHDVRPSLNGIWLHWWTSQAKLSSLSLSLSRSPCWRPFSRWTWVSRYQNVSILDFVRAKEDVCGGDNWSYKTFKAPVKSSPPTKQHPVFYRLDALPVAQPTVSEHWREYKIKSYSLLNISLNYCILQSLLSAAAVLPMFCDIRELLSHRGCLRVYTR